jgi:hypothetical protein
MTLIAVFYHDWYSFSMSSSKQNFILRDLDEPVSKDWIFWLWIIMTVLSNLNVINQLSTGPGESIDLVAGVIDGAIAVGSQWLVFNLVPRSIRKNIRARRSSK